MNIEDSVKEIIARICGVEAGQIRPDARLVEYGLDSVRAMDLVISLEEEFSIAIPDDLARRAKTMRDVLDFLENGSARHGDLASGYPANEALR